MKSNLPNETVSPSRELLAENAFRSGNYSQSYQLTSCPELAGCSLILLGDIERGYPNIKGSTRPRNRFCGAIALWHLGKKREAQNLLDGIVDDPEYGSAAQKLLKWVRQSKIRILLQARDDSKHPNYDHVGNFRSIQEADVITVGYASHSDIPIRPTTTLDEVLGKLPEGWIPDIFLSHMLEDHPPPIGIEHAPFPTLFHTQDYDRHFHHCYHLMKLFDAAIALGSCDHSDLAQLGCGQAFVFPLLLGVNASPKTSLSRKKILDFYISGKQFDNNEGKSKSIYKLLQLPENFNIYVHDGYVHEEFYYHFLRQAKCTFTYVNRWGLINGRALEALSMGCCVLYQEGGELGIFLGPDEGAIPYRDETLSENAMEVIQNWDSKYKMAAERGAHQVRKFFDIKKCTKRYLFNLVTFASLIEKKGKPITTPFSNIRYPNRSPFRIQYSCDWSRERLLSHHEDFRAHLTNSNSYEVLDAIGESFLYSHVSQKHLPTQIITMTSGLRTQLISLLSKTKSMSMFKIFKVLKTLWNLFKKAVGAFRRATNKLALGKNQSTLGALIDSIDWKYLFAAKNSYTRLVAEHPKRLAALFNLARIEFELKEYVSAKNLFLKIITCSSLRYRPNDLLFWREFHDSHFDYDALMRNLVSYRIHGQEKYIKQIEKIIWESSLFYLGTILAKKSNSLDDAAVLLENFMDPSTDSQLLWLLKIRLNQTETISNDLTSIHKIKPWFFAVFRKDLAEVLDGSESIPKKIASDWKRLNLRLHNP